MRAACHDARRRSSRRRGLLLDAALEAVPADVHTTVAPWAGEPLVDVDFTGHLHDEHVEPVRAWLDGQRGSRPT